MIDAALGFLTGGSATRLAATLLAGVVLGGWAGWQVQDWRHGRIDAQRIERQARDTLRNIERGQQAADAYTTGEVNAQPARKEIVRTVEKIVTRPVYRNVCLDADGLQQLRAAISTGAPASGAAAAVPTVEPTE
jgi:uncharacterized protein YcfJ